MANIGTSGTIFLLKLLVLCNCYALDIVCSGDFHAKPYQRFLFICFETSLLTSQSENMAALPIVSNVRVKKLSSVIYCGEGEYFGGYEGSSLFSWYRETTDGTIILINGANSSTYEVTDSDYNCRLLFG